MQADVVVLGAGAAGLMCALTAGRRGRRVWVLERANRPGKKILMSGGGRCNFTHLDAGPQHYLSANPHFVKSALARYTPRDFLELVHRHRIGYHEKTPGQLFCNDSARPILQMLLDECAAAGVRIVTDCAVDMVRAEAAGFRLSSRLGELTTVSLVVACGGLSIPSLGGSGFGYALARQFGHRVWPTRAGLVPLTLSGRHAEDYQGLAGVSLARVGVRIGRQGFEDGLLFTHRGVSGPAILQISSYWQPGADLRLDFAPGQSLADWLLAERKRHPGAELRTRLAEPLPKRLAQRLCERWLGSQPLCRYGEPELRALGRQLQDWPLIASGSEGYRTAEVTLGGVACDELSSTTMASKRMAGLYFVGEVLDVAGHLGGYNFQWAWASAHAAGEVA